jgi:hypothetical protein
MTNRNSWSAWLVFALSAVILIVMRGMLLTAGSIDFAAHLSLVDFISNNVDFPRWSGDYHNVKVIPYLGVMTVYPPISHAFGAVAGWALRSEIAGMNAVALMSVFVAYTVLLYLCVRAENLVCAILFVAMALALGPFGFLHGGQLILNYFYAHIFGTAALLCLLYVVVFILSGWTATAFAVVSACFLGWIYPLSEIQFSACFLVYLAAETFTKSMNERVVAWRLLAQTGVTTVLLLVVTVLHPEFKIMITISGNNGGILPTIETRYITMLAALLMIAGLIVIWSNIKRQSKLGLLIAALAVGVSAIYVLQWAALYFLDLGSPYALKKHIFDIVTLLCLILAYVMGVLVGRLLPPMQLTPSHSMMVSSVLALTVTLEMFSAAPAASIGNIVRSTNIANIVRFKRYAADMMTYQLPEDAYGTTISLSGNLSPSDPFEKVLNLSASNIELGMPFHVAANFFYEGKAEGIRYALVPSNSTWGISECRITKPTHVAIVAVDYACADAARSSVEIDQIVETRIGGIEGPFLTSGWGGLEQDGVWSIADHASLNIKLRNRTHGETVTLVLNLLAGLLNERHKTQRIIISVGGRELWSGQVEYGLVPRPIEIKVPTELTSSGEIVVDLFLPDAMSPKKLDINEDDRNLGIKLKSFVLRR